MRAIGLMLAGLMFTAVVAAIVFASAGRIDLPYVWACLAINALFWIAAAIVLPRELIGERMHPGKEGRVHDLHRTMAIPLLLAAWVLTGLDLGRWHWGDTIPRAVQVIGLAGYALGLAATLWAMRTNRFFSSIIRLQLDRGHEPVTHGPYRFIRHPGYAGTILAFVCGQLGLGSWLGVLPMIPLLLLYIRRTVSEDRMLQRDLPGYGDYAARVRSRLVPGIW